jgi:NADH:ubiquinone oxidoreductase subunit 6 (subunit J)
MAARIGRLDVFGWKKAKMQNGNMLVAVAIGAVAVVLVFGLVNMMRGGSANTSQKLMRWRVGLQFVALVVIMAILWLRG